MQQASEVLRVAEAAARAGGEVALRHRRNPIMAREKSPADLVTDADLESERAVAAVIRAAFPEHAILGEETLTADVNSDHLWLIDPIDGTTNFAHQIPHFAVSVAYYRSGVPAAAAVLNPARDDMFLAERGKGAWHNGQRSTVGSQDRLADSLIGIGFYYDRGHMMECMLSAVRDLFKSGIHGVRRFGTASLDLCHVGVGYYGAFFEYQLSPWDFAAGRLFVEEAGGKVTTAKGDSLPLAKTSVLASNTLLHDAVLEISKRNHP